MREVEVFFKNENDAESARAELQKYEVSDLRVEQMPERRNRGFIPLFSPGSGSGSAGIPYFTGDSEESEAEEADSKHMSHKLRFEVKEEDYDEAISALKEYDVYSLRADEQ